MNFICSLTLFLTLLIVMAGPSQASYSFREVPISFSKVILIPGAASENDDLYLGHIYYGKYFSIYTRELEKRKIPFEVLNSSSTGNESITQRTNKLIRFLDKQKEPVLVIGHSLGGLVARLALRRPEAAKKVAATVTISTPHKGTPVSDWFLQEERIPQNLAAIGNIFGFDINEKQYLEDISLKSKDKWNTDLDHQNHIQNLFSVVASQDTAEHLRTNAIFALGDKIIRNHPLTGPDKMNDGLVPRDSQIWGKCILFVKKNHGSVIGKDFTGPPSRDVLPQIFEKLSQKGIHYKSSFLMNHYWFSL